LKGKHSKGFKLDEAKAFLNYLHHKLPADIYYRVEEDMGLVYIMGSRSSDSKEDMAVERTDRRGDFMINSGLIVPCKLGYLLKGNHINPERPWEYDQETKESGPAQAIGFRMFPTESKWNGYTSGRVDKMTLNYGDYFRSCNYLAGPSPKTLEFIEKIRKTSGKWFREKYEEREKYLLPKSGPLF